MADILGLSHLIFSSKCKLLPQDSPLSTLFSAPISNSFDHFEAKKKLLRDQTYKKTDLALYISKEGELPGFELIPGSCEISRPLSSYGLILDAKFADIFKNAEFYGYPLNLEDKIPNIKNFYLEASLPSLIAISPIFKEYSCAMGIWYHVPDIDMASDFMIGIIGAKSLCKFSFGEIFSVKAINKKFSNFMIAIIKNDLPDAYYYNDDIGFAAFGWIAKRKVVLPAKFANSFSLSPEFKIDMNGKKFNAEFIYDNRSPSHEIMVLEKQ